MSQNAYMKLDEIKSPHFGGKIVLHLFIGIQLGKKIIFWDQSQNNWDQLDPSQDCAISTPYIHPYGFV